MLMLQQLITLRASQRAEYLADAIAARVASPASMAAALDTIVTGQSTHSWILERRQFSDARTLFWDQLRSALLAVPETEKERRRRVRARARLRATSTHPPTHLRVRMLEARPKSRPALTLTAAQEAAIRAELAADYTRIATQIDDSVGLATR